MAPCNNVRETLVPSKLQQISNVDTHAIASDIWQHSITIAASPDEAELACMHEEKAFLSAD